MFEKGSEGVFLLDFFDKELATLKEGGEGE